MYFGTLTSDCIIWIAHEIQWVLLCFFDVKHYFLKNEQVQKREIVLQIIQKKIKGKEINTLNEWFLNQEKNICFKVRFQCVDTVLS